MAAQRFQSTVSIRLTMAATRGKAVCRCAIGSRGTQEDVAVATGANRVTVSRWENGSSVPTLVLGLRLAEVLGVDPFELFLGRPRGRAGRKRT